MTKQAFKRNRLEPIFSLLSEWRDSNIAPVDTMGCDALAEKKDLKIFRFQTLIALILSSQTKDQTVAEAMRKLQQHDLSVNGVLKMNKDTLHECISKVGFHNRKLEYILETCQIIVDKYDGDIPKDINDLMKLPGVGPKMAYLTMQVAWNETIGIGVDTHVHRISNRIGWIRTRTPEESRLELQDWLPKSHWAKINHLLVGFGQLHCKPVKPSCHDCPGLMMTLDWNNLKFEYLQTRSFIKYVWNGVCWDNGALINEPYINLHIDATCLHYGQSCFEGLKAFHMADGKIRIFRPLLNAKRLQSSCKAVSLEPPPFDLFLEALKRVVEDNSDFVPPYGSGGSLYIRPFVIGSGVKIGLSPSAETTFMIFVNPVGNYYAGGIGSPVKALIMHGFDRAAPRGTGSVKVGGNYAPCLGPSAVARKKGYTITLFLDAKTGKNVEEFSSSNFAALTHPDSAGNRSYVTPKSASILPSITNRSLMEIGRRLFGWKCERRDVPWTTVLNGEFAEIVACGTAAILTPIGEIHREVPTRQKMKSKTYKTEEEEIWDDSDLEYELDVEEYKVCDKIDGFKQLYDAYRALQVGDLENWKEFNWMWPSDGLDRM